MSAKGTPPKETLIPWSVVLFSVGIIVLLTTGVIWLLMQRQPVVVAEGLIATAALPTAPTPTEPVDAGEEIALLPETPLDMEEYPPHFVSALEAAVPNVGQPIRILIPELSIDAPVTVVGMQAIEQNGQTFFQWQVPSEAKAGWHNTSARLGEPGNTVLNGHHNIFGELFRDLVDLEPGDEIVMYDPQKTYTYTVDQVLILEERNQPLAVRQENAQWIAPTEDERLTLVTCWPYTDNSHRVVVVAYPSAQNGSN